MGVVAMKVMAGGPRPRGGRPIRERLKRQGGMLAALKWVLRRPNVHTTIPSMTDMDQLDENLRAMAEPLTKADEQKLAGAARADPPALLPMCGRCEGACPQGLPVADVLRYLTYAEGYGQFALGREHFLELAEGTARRALLGLRQLRGALPRGRGGGAAGRARAGALRLRRPCLERCGAAVTARRSRRPASQGSRSASAVASGFGSWPKATFATPATFVPLR